MRIVSVFFLSTENDLHRNLPVNIGRDINLHNNRVRAERVKRARACARDGIGWTDTRDTRRIFGTRARR